MRRMQVYLDENLLNALRELSQREGTSVSELLRRAVRERYLSDFEDRRTAMESLIGIWANRSDMQDSEKYVRELRKSDRIERLRKFRRI